MVLTPEEVRKLKVENEHIEIPFGYTEIAEKAFFDNNILKGAITALGSGAPNSAHALPKMGNIKSMTIPDSVTAIGDRAFSDCTSLTRITIPDSVTSIGDKIFFFMSNHRRSTFTWVVMAAAISSDYQRKNLIVSCPPDSYACIYCRENGINVKLI